jgi:hypothetical protein
MPDFKIKGHTLAEAAALIPDGARVHFEGMSLHNHPWPCKPRRSDGPGRREIARGVFAVTIHC